MKVMLLALLLQATAVEAWSTSFGTVNHQRFVANRQYRSHACRSFSSPLLSSSTEVTEEAATPFDPPNPTALLSVEAHSGLTDEEFSVIVETVEDAYVETVGLEGVSCQVGASARRSASEHHTSDGSDDGLLVGALRRVLLLETNLDGESAECLRASIAERFDHLLYGSGELSQPVLVSVQTPSERKHDDTMQEAARIGTIVQTEIEQYGLRTPISQKYNNDDDKENSVVNDDDDETTTYTPALRIEIDGAETSIDGSGETFWDTSSVVVFDNLVSDDLRKRLLDVIKGESSDADENNWNDVEHGPDPNRWVRGGLLDIPDDDDNDNEIDDDDEEQEKLSSWGLRAEVVEEICFGEHEAIVEFESILANLFPLFVVTRLPEAVYGECTSPLTANAPVAGEEGLYDYHIDGDPLQTPPSPWTDVYGRYPNRAPGKPRFVSCIVYLNDEWNETEWGAGTQFYDPPTETSYEVLPRPGRCVILDQDLGHTVTPPAPSAGKRPRYSMVWKLVLHPTKEHQDMTDLPGASFSALQTQSRCSWPKPILFGSAAEARS